MAKSTPKPAAKAPAKSAQPAAKPAPKPVFTKHNPKAAPSPVAKAAPASVTKAAPAALPAAGPAPILRTTGLSPKQQRLLALREKLAHKNSGAKPLPGASASAFKAKASFTGKKTAFQRKAV
jgi:hypothetical protein